MVERAAHLRTLGGRSGTFELVRRVDWILLTAVLALTGIGLVMVDSTGAGFEAAGLSARYGVEHQTVYACVALVMFVVAIVIDYHHVEELAYPFYLAVLFALLAVRAIGHSSLGAAREISVGPFAIQPSEFGVLAVAAVITLYISRHESELDLRRLAVLIAFAIVPMAFVLAQPDLGTTLLTGVVFMALLFFSGLRMRFIVGMFLVVAAVAAAAYLAHLVPKYQLGRLTTILDPAHATAAQKYNVTLSEGAIGAGGLQGTGLFNGQVTNLAYVPIQYSDFIFSAIGEQLGFVGSVVVLGLYALVGFRIFRAMQLARDSIGRLLCGAAFVFVLASVFENVGMASGVMPVTGIPLPFISYGGSALFAFYAAIGIVMNVELRRGGRR